MQTQWSWILQLCYCVEQHLKENITYFEAGDRLFCVWLHLNFLVCLIEPLLPEQFFNDAKESMDYLKNLQDSITRKYGCDRTSSLHRLEDLIQESMVSILQSTTQRVLSYHQSLNPIYYVITAG